MNTRPATANPDSWKDRLLILPFILFFILLSLLTLNLPFFWDKDILYSRIAHWLLENHFSMVLPDSLDPGYMPALGYLLAAAWKVFGVTLPVMHLLMLPFTLGIVWLTRLLLGQFLDNRKLYLAMLLVLADTTFLAQTVVFSTDLVMLFFMLLALNSVMHNRRWLLVLAVTGLLFSHMRGLMVAATIGIFDLYRNGSWNNPLAAARRLPPYLPGLILFTAWMVFHYLNKGWIGYHDASPWAPCYELVDGAGFIRNCAIALWRLVDFGHVFVWAVVTIGVYPLLRKRSSLKEPLASLLLLLGVSLLVTLPTMLLYRMLNGHRYLIPVYYFLSVLAVYLLFGIPGQDKLKRVLAVVMLAGMLSGNFWVYPDTVAKGWDATLAHLPYHHLRQKMRQYIDQNHIPVVRTGSHIPNTARIDYIELNGDQRAFPQADLPIHPYIFYSNVFNMFTDEEIAELKRDWIVEQEYCCLQVRVTLYKKQSLGLKCSDTR